VLLLQSQETELNNVIIWVNAKNMKPALPIKHLGAKIDEIYPYLSRYSEHHLSCLM
jgi:hypothetical protein